MEEILGVNMYTWASWAGDVERTDCWSDGGADSIRQLNLVANARWSQKVENGTLANFGMYFYDSTAKEGWTPVGYDPSPFGFYPLPGKPADVLQPVEIDEMEPSLESSIGSIRRSRTFQEPRRSRTVIRTQMPVARSRPPKKSRSSPRKQKTARRTLPNTISAIGSTSATSLSRSSWQTGTPCTSRRFTKSELRANITRRPSISRPRIRKKATRSRSVRRLTKNPTACRRSRRCSSALPSSRTTFL